MGKIRYPWWGYIKQIMYRYPHCEPFEREAVEQVIEATKGLEDGQSRMKVISLVYFKKTHKLAGAALQVPCSYQLAKEWQQQFIRDVAAKIKCDGLLKV